MRIKSGFKRFAVAAAVASTAVTATVTPLALTGAQTVTATESSVFENITIDLSGVKEKALKGVAGLKLLIDQGVRFVTENEKIASIKDGMIVALKEGSTKLYAVTSAGAKILVGKINVVKKDIEEKVIPVIKVKFDEAKITLAEGASKVIKAAIEPFNATDKELIWKVDDEKIAKVVDGVVTAVKEGSTKVKAMTKDGKVFAEMVIDVIKSGKTDIVNMDGIWTYTKNCKPDYNYTCFAKNVNGWWYVENGIVTFGKNDVIQGTVDGTNAWWNVKGSKVLFNTTIENNRNGWWYIKDGKVDFGYTGYASNYNGWWYVEDGKVTFKRNDIIQGNVGGVNAWWNVKGSKVLFNTTIENNQNGWWYIKDGKVDFGYTGFAKNANGWWYVENGKVTFKRNDIIQGNVRGTNGWWNIKGSKVIFNTTIENNQNGWWYIKNGKVDFGYTGFAKNVNGWWYVENGKVTFKKNGRIKGNIEGINATWTVKNSKVTEKA